MKRDNKQGQAGDERRVRYALLDLQAGLQEASNLHARPSSASPRAGALLALYHVKQFIRTSLPGVGHLPIEHLTEALAMLDAGSVDPLVSPNSAARGQGRPVKLTTEIDVAALLSAAASFLIKKDALGERLSLDDACLMIARAATKLGFGCADGTDLTKDVIISMRAELTSRRISTETRSGSTIEKHILRGATKVRGRLQHDRLYRFLRIVPQAVV